MRTVNLLSVCLQIHLGVCCILCYVCVSCNSLIYCASRCRLRQQLVSSLAVRSYEYITVNFYPASS